MEFYTEDDAVVAEFKAGVDAYWAGEVPENLSDSKARESSPYLMGWYMVSQLDTGQTLVDRDGDPMGEN